MLKLIAAATLIATAAPAFAQAHGTTRSVHVSYADLDLRQADGVKQFDRRLRAAIGAVCPDGVSTDRFATADVMRCRNAAAIALKSERAAAIAKATATTQLALNTNAR